MLINGYVMLCYVMALKTEACAPFLLLLCFTAGFKDDSHVYVNTSYTRNRDIIVLCVIITHGFTDNGDQSPRYGARYQDGFPPSDLSR